MSILAKIVLAQKHETRMPNSVRVSQTIQILKQMDLYIGTNQYSRLLVYCEAGFSMSTFLPALSMTES